MPNVLITGAAGFIGHHVVEHILLNTDWNIIALDRLDYSGNLNRLDYVIQKFSPNDKKRVKVVFHDLKAAINPQVCNAIGDIDYIIHLAAGSHVDRSIIYPMEFVMDNVVGTVNLLDYARGLHSLKKFVYFSTDEVFGPAPLGVKFKENDRYNSTNPYSASKAAGEEMVVAYQNTYNLPIIIVHGMNVFGERQHPEKFIPMCIRKIADGEVVEIHSDPSRTIPGSRVYVHAKDIADAVLFLIDYDLSTIPTSPDEVIKCHKFNIVGEKEINNLELASFIANAQGKELKCELVDFHTSRPGHDLRYALDGTKMKQLGWVPKSTDNRLTDVIHWSIANDIWIR
jgi:dTDP-glucose 4,6-dehydratase